MLNRKTWKTERGANNAMQNNGMPPGADYAEVVRTRQGYKIVYASWSCEPGGGGHLEPLE